MKLFFETAGQANCFLRMLPLGFAAAALLYAGPRQPVLRCITDLLIMFAAGAALMILVIFCREPTLRMYHLLGALTGAVLYIQGIGKIIRRAVRRKELRRHAAK